MNMKKTLALLLVVTMGLGYAAQVQAGFKIGPRIGLNVNKLSTSGKIGDLFDSSNNCGFTVGVQAEYMTPISLGVDLSLMYTYMDYQVEEDMTGTNQNMHPKFAKNFIEIPLNIKYKIGIPAVKKIFSPYVFTGPSVALKLGKDKGYNMGSINAKTNTKTAQWVWNLGIGLEFINHLQIGASYGFGMNNIVKDFEVEGTTLQTGEVKAKTGYWTVTAAWLF